ncbi:MAG: hypothetical protein HQL69_16055 [Magnetococcales bacterium]|nr:hypothetical protein [Magnetococcales bacterium]
MPKKSRKSKTDKKSSSKKELKKINGEGSEKDAGLSVSAKKEKKTKKNKKKDKKKDVTQVVALSE